MVLFNGYSISILKKFPSVSRTITSSPSFYFSVSFDLLFEDLQKSNNSWLCIFQCEVMSCSLEDLHLPMLGLP